MLERKALIMAEFHCALDDNAPIYELMYLSDLAWARRKERKRAKREGLHYDD
ncbi:hypothetical protein D3C87_1841770 [compost metagenome]